jgi:hypothetical protein
MSGGGIASDPGDGPPARLSLWQRLLLALPRLGRDRDTPLGERIRGALVKPADPSQPAAAKTVAKPETVEEIEAALKSADDKERLIGLLAAPLAAIIGISVTSALIANDPPAYLKNGRANPLHVSVSLYHNLTLVVLALAVLILVTAWFRKRMFMGISMALYGLAVFNLHYWGFGIPFVLAGAWYLVRSYRLQQDLRVATGQRAPRPGQPRPGGGGKSPGGRPSASGRYTPPSPPRRSSPKKPDNEKRAS